MNAKTTNWSTNTVKERTNEEWVSALQGTQGITRQQQSHTELANYLYIVSVNYLNFRHSSVPWLAQSDDDELAALAEDGIQQFFIKLIQDDYVLLTKYNGSGRFLSWAAQVMRNMVASELRRPYWRRRASLDEVPFDTERLPINQSTTRPDLAVQFRQVTEIVQDALACMSSRNRTIFVRYVLDGERANVVAKDLGISTNGVYIAAHRLRKEVKEILASAGFGTAGPEMEVGAG